MAAFKDRQFLLLAATLALTCLLGWAFKAHCLPGGWTDAEQYTTGCYSDAVPFWIGRGLAAGEIPYLQTPLEYPVLTGALIWAEGAVTRTLFGASADAADFLLVVSLANAGLAFAILWLFRRAGMEPRRLWCWAGAPPLILYLGHNWDLLAALFAVAALLAARAGRPIWAGALAGLGFAAKLFPVLLVPLLELEAPARRRWGVALAIGAAALLAWGLVNAPVALLAPVNWAEFFRFSIERPGTAASIWQIAASFGLPTSIAARNLYAGLLFLAGAAGIIALGWRRHHARLWVLFTPLLAWFMLANKVYSPQFDLWLYPLLLLTAPRLWPVAWFVIGDIAAYFGEFWWLAGSYDAVPYATSGDIALLAGIRAAAMLWLIADALRRDPPAWLSRTANAPAAARTER